LLEIQNIVGNIMIDATKSNCRRDSCKEHEKSVMLKEVISFSNTNFCV